MNEPLPEGLRQELLDDYYAECDELLSAARNDLMVLEQKLERRQFDQAAVENVFRCLHTLKGGSAMVGLGAAEKLAHSCEDLLRKIAKRELALTEPMIGSLLAALQAFEGIVVAQRQGKTIPKNTKAIAELARWHSPQNSRSSDEKAAPATPSTPVATAATPEETEVAAQAAGKGLALWRFTFAPSAELSQRGLNINAIKDKLAALGEIFRTTPRVIGRGQLQFELLVGLRQSPAEIEALQLPGLHGEPVATPDQSPATDETAADDENSLTPSHIVRVDLERLDRLMRITGEMMITRFNLEDRIARKKTSADDLKDITRHLDRSLRDLREALARVRLVPIAEIFSRIPFVVRDLSRNSDKKARVAISGSQIEIDKFLVERLKEPLLHLVRNAFSHGIEPAAERLALGKPAEATITLRASPSSEFVLVEIADDGRGLDRESIVARARALNLPLPEEIDEAALLQLICNPGFSTRKEADLTSGRGVGMAVVANVVRELGGTLTVQSELGRGSTFSLKLPLSLSIAAAILVAAGGETCAIPQSAVAEIIQVPASEIRRINQDEVIGYREGLLPIAALGDILKVAPARSPLLTLLVVSTPRGAVGVSVDRVVAQREIVIRPLVDPLVRVEGITGVTEVGDGRLILILDPATFTQHAVRPGHAQLVSPA